MLRAGQGYIFVVEHSYSKSTLPLYLLNGFYIDKGTAMALLNVREVYKVFELKKSRVVAVDGVSFSIEKPSFVTLLGPNGAGKTTLLNIIAAIIPPTRGKVMIKDIDVWSEPYKAKKLIGFVPQEYGIIDMFTVMENLNYAADLYRLPRNIAYERIRFLLKFFDLEEHKHKLAVKLSGGLKRRLSIAMSLIHDPEILILDEPTTGLDPGIRREFIAMLKKFVKNGKLVLMSTHIAEEAELSDSTIIMHRGKIVALGTPEDLKINTVGLKTIVDLVVEPTNQIDSLVQELSEKWFVIKHGNIVRVFVESFEKEVPEVMTFIQRKGFNVVEIRARKPTLYDVFLKLTGYELGEE